MDQPTDDPGERRGKAVRYGVPLAIAGLAAATIGLVPALAQSGSGPDLKKLSAEDLITKVLDSKTETLSGNVKINTDLGLPALPGGMGGGMGGDSGKDSSADPRAKAMELFSGTHTLRVAVDGEDRQRVSMGEFTAIHNKDDLWAYESESDEVYHAEVPQERDNDDAKGDHKAEDLPEGLQDLTPREFAEKALKAADKTTAVTADGTTQVAGRDAYQLKIEPKQQQSTVRDIRVAVDAETGAPLKFTLTADDGKRVFDAGFTTVDFGKPDAGQFEFTPPEGAKVTEGGQDSDKGRQHDQAVPEGLKNLDIIGDGWTSVARIDMPKGAPNLSDMGDKGGAAVLDAFTEKVDGGRVFSTRLVNVLVTDDGRVYAGAVTKDGLVKAAKADD